MVCSKCKAKQRLLYSVVQFADPDLLGEGQVQMRGGVYVDTLAGLVRLTPAQILTMPFGQIKSILDAEGDILYFTASADKSVFLNLYPEYAAWNI
jgi:hypothetical protein